MPPGRSLTLTGAMAQHARNKSAPGLILPRVKDHMLKNYGWDANRDPTVIHPSEMAKTDAKGESTWCLRATYLRITSGAWPPVKEKFDYVRENIFATGNDIHTKWQTRMIDAGFPMWGDWKCRRCETVVTGLEPHDDDYAGDCIGTLTWHDWQYAEVTLNARDKLLIAGHSDGAFDKSLVEIKSIGLGTVRMDAPALLKEYQEDGKTDLTGLWKAIRRPLRSHLNQGDIYLHLAHVLDLPYTQIVYLYEFKANQMTREFTITYNAERVKPLIAKAEHVMYAVEHGIPPECIKGPGGCKECNAFPPTKRRTVAGTRSDITPGH